MNPPERLARVARRARLPVALVLAVAVAGCARYPHTVFYGGGLETGEVEITRASWVSPDLKGKVGAYGDIHDPDALIAAHPSLPYGTFVRVYNLDNGRAAVLRITDRAKDRPDKRLFVSKRAAELLDMVDAGVANVRIEPIEAQVGIASWYGSMFHGRRTSSGEVYDQNALTAAHRFLPFGTTLRVTNLETERSVLVRVNDRGGFIKGRVVDLSRRAAEEIGVLANGKAAVRVEIVRPPSPNGRES
jgi:rare lipoprotein A (peptidoglycan hydrolase)